MAFNMVEVTTQKAAYRFIFVDNRQGICVCLEHALNTFLGNECKKGYQTFQCKVFFYYTSIKLVLLELTLLYQLKNELIILS